MARNYKNYGAQESARIIISECVRTGESSNWCGDESDFLEVSSICKKFNVRYVDDWTGTWAVRPPEGK